MSQLLFVYGTLRRLSRHPMAKFLADRARFVGEATVPGQLFNLGRYPGLIESSSASDRVVGDVYELADGSETLRDLDSYEETESPRPSVFERGLAEVTLSDGRKLRAMVYWFRGPVTDAQRIRSGDYREALQSV
jgi:gamma-glutamylcyclotransferase (GGCT)/AIG2-like uncharacterized protein YtfP